MWRDTRGCYEATVPPLISASILLRFLGRQSMALSLFLCVYKSYILKIIIPHFLSDGSSNQLSKIVGPEYHLTTKIWVLNVPKTLYSFNCNKLTWILSQGFLIFMYVCSICYGKLCLLLETISVLAYVICIQFYLSVNHFSSSVSEVSQFLWEIGNQETEDCKVSLNQTAPCIFPCASHLFYRQRYSLW